MVFLADVCWDGGDDRQRQVECDAGQAANDAGAESVQPTELRARGAADDSCEDVLYKVEQLGNDEVESRSRIDCCSRSDSSSGGTAAAA